MTRHDQRPTVDRPTMPDGYGIPPEVDGVLEWRQVEAELVAAQHFWLTSVRPDGRPHVVPRWGVWLRGAFYYDGAPSTVHAQNANTHPAVTLNLESGTRAVIIEGSSVATRADPASLGEALALAFEKYATAGYRPASDAWAGDDGGGLRILAPQRALAWFDFPHDCTRFRF